jgi:hypothetical protein
MRRQDWLLSLLTPFWATFTFACTVAQDLRPYSPAPRRRTARPHRHRCTSVTGLARHLCNVHHAINGSPGTTATVDALPPSTCSVAFAVGQRWLYAGPATSQPSVLLQADAHSAARSTDFGRLAARGRRSGAAPGRLADLHEATAQCEPVPIGCQRTAANAANAAAARAQCHEESSVDHRAMECATPPGGGPAPHLGQQCVASRCGHWVLDLRLRPCRPRPAPASP